MVEQLIADRGVKTRFSTSVIGIIMSGISSHYISMITYSFCTINAFVPLLLYTFFYINTAFIY